MRMLLVIWMAGLHFGCSCSMLQDSCVDALVTGTYHLEPDGSIRELNMLIAVGENRRILTLIVQTHDARVIDQLRTYAIDRDRLRDVGELYRMQRLAHKPDEQFVLADILICRADPQGYLVMLDAFKEVERLRHGERPDEVAYHERLRSMIISYLIRACGKALKSPADFEQWIKDNCAGSNQDLGTSSNDWLSPRDTVTFRTRPVNPTFTGEGRGQRMSPWNDEVNHGEATEVWAGG